MDISQTLADKNLDDLLADVSKKYQVVFEDVKVGEHRLQILQIADLEKHIDRLAEESRERIELPFWAKIWPSSILLSYFLTSGTLDKTQGRIIELGCGIGLAGLFAASSGYNVVLSDYSHDALMFSQINILKNNLQDRARVIKADFTKDRLDQRFEYIIGSEIFYQESGYRGLVKFLLHHLNATPACEVILAADYRRGAKKFFQLADREFYISQKNIGYKGHSAQNGQEKFLCAIYRMKAKKR